MAKILEQLRRYDEAGGAEAAGEAGGDISCWRYFCLLALVE
ncbi:hypothetical protein MC7420_3421 [Coleofasciculus chthonoplastes PCC 7420]|uniref:Uncharacterized protein n=1 Tax=Coleofasciculus chthonoplastes PCC 7420 TaxID=118168 RepID=B4W3F4_9CYAN|nr:hypothetical protein MC7420_3421 [Coleofasciculus chthonoplastes PCC 7420]